MKQRKSKAELLRRVGNELGRELTTANLFLHSLIASKVGLNATDTRCLDLIGRSGSTPITAGELTRATGFTTGAITGILDRLERAGFVERVKDASDRRKVFVRTLPGSGLVLMSLYKDLGGEMEKLALTYSISELELIEKFLTENLKILKDQIGKLSSH